MPGSVHSHTVESLLRRTRQRCLALAYICGSREGQPSEEVWSGLEDLFADLAADLLWVRNTLTTEDANGTPR